MIAIKLLEGSQSGSARVLYQIRSLGKRIPDSEKRAIMTRNNMMEDNRLGFCCVM